MKIDRGGQLRLLRLLAGAYPAKMSSHELRQIWGSEDELVPNAHYLQEHGLVDAVFSSALSGPIHMAGARITARGLDFLADDGGLTAILGVVTVRLEAETVRQLMAGKIEQSDLPTHEKSRLLATLQSLPGEALKELTKRLVGAGIEHAPNVLKLLDTLTGL